MKRATKKLLSVLLAVLLLVSLVPIGASAVDYEEWTDSDSLPTSGVYKLMTNVTVSGEVRIGSWASTAPETPSKTLVIDLNGYTIDTTAGQIFYVYTTGGLTIEDSSPDGTGKVTNASASRSSEVIYVSGDLTISGGTIENVQRSTSAVFVNSDGDAWINGGTIINSGTGGTALFVNGSNDVDCGGTVVLDGGTIRNTVNGGDAVFVNGGNGDGATFIMESGTVDQQGTYSSDAAIDANNTAKLVEINGGNVTSDSMGVYAAFTDVMVTGGTFETASHAFQTRYANIAPAEEGAVSVTAGGSLFYVFRGSDNQVSGGDFKADALVSEYTREETSYLDITGGTFDLTSAVLKNASNSEVTIYSGSFPTQDVEDYVAPGNKQDEDGDIVADESTSAAVVDGVGYTDLLDAIDHLKDGSTMTIISGEYDVTKDYSNSRFGSAFVIEENNVTIQAANPKDKPVIYSFSNFFNDSIIEGAYGQGTIYVTGENVTLKDLVILPSSGIGENANTWQKTVGVKAGATGFEMTGCETKPNDKEYEGQTGSMATSAGLIHVSIPDATIKGNSFGTGTKICSGWIGATADEGEYPVNVSGNFWGEGATLADIANMIDGNVSLDTYYQDANMTKMETVGGTPVSTMAQLTRAIASADDGDVIIVAPGKYEGNVSFKGKSLTLKAQYPAYVNGAETAADKVSEFTGTMSTYYSADGVTFPLNTDQAVVIDGFKFTGDGLKVGDCSYNTVGNLTVQNCVMVCGNNLASSTVPRYGNNMYNYFVKVTGSEGEPYASVTVQNNLVTGKPADGAFPIHPIQLWDVSEVNVLNNVLDLEDASDSQAISISILSEDAQINVSGNEINGAGGGIYVTTWKLGGSSEDGAVTFKGKVTISDNTLTGAGVEPLEAIFVGYTADGGYGQMGGILEQGGNTNDGAPAEAVVGVKEEENVVSYVLTYMVDDVEYSKVTVFGTTATLLPAPEKEDYTFYGWYDGTNIYDASAVIPVSGDMTFEALWLWTPEGGADPLTQYAIVIEDAAHGSVTASYERAAAGVTVYLTVEADTGYTLSSLTVKDADGKAVAVELLQGNLYAFVMPDSDVTVTAVFASQGGEVEALPFDDVTEGDWFYEAVAYVYENGMMEGVADDAFAPRTVLNRAMMVQILYNMEGRPAVSGSGVFSDVKAGEWYADAVNWAAANQIVDGMTDDTFCPLNSLTREQMAAILYRYAQYKGYDVSEKGDLNAFDDGNLVSDWAVDAMTWAVGTKLITGKTDTTIDPLGTAIRAEVAQIIMNYSENIVK